MSPLWHNAPRTVDFWKIIQLFLSYASSNNNWHHRSNHMPCGARERFTFSQHVGGKRNTVKWLLYSNHAQGTYYSMAQATWNPRNFEEPRGTPTLKTTQQTFGGKNKNREQKRKTEKKIKTGKLPPRSMCICVSYEKQSFPARSVNVCQMPRL